MATSSMRTYHSDVVSHAPAASRASWIGTLQLNDFTVPVKAFAAIASVESHLHHIHAGCGRRVSLRTLCPDHGTLESNAIQKAFAYSPDLLVALSDDELSQLSPIDEKTIVIERFFSPEQLDLALLAGRSLFLVPASLAAQHSFSLLKAALDQKRVWALGRTVFSQKRHLIVVHSHDETVLLHTLHDPALRRMPVPCRHNGDSPSRSEVREFARALDDCGDPIPWMDFRDNFHEQLATLVTGKIGAKGEGRNGTTASTAATRSKRQRHPRTTTKAA